MSAAGLVPVLALASAAGLQELAGEYLTVPTDKGANAVPSGKFTANAAWIVLAVMAFNLTRAAATITGPGLANATTATIRRKLINVPARVATSARRVTLHLSAHWPWATAWSHLFIRVCGPPPAPAT